jgi:uncharacterized protein YidB (DUF937 family)
MGGWGGGSGMQGVLMNLLGSGQQNQQSGPGGFASGGATGGDLSGLISSFEQAGLGHLVQSWIGDGPNQPVSPDQLHSVPGDDQVQSMSNHAGMAPHDFLSQLSQPLPAAVNGMTPNGRLPDDGSVSV